VLGHLPAALVPVVEFAYITGWRVQSEVLPLQWRHVDLDAGEVRLDPGTTKNAEGRTFPITTELRRVLDAQRVIADALKAQNTLCPWVFHRRAKRILEFGRAWTTACRLAGCPGRLVHDLRPDSGAESGARGGAGNGGDAVDRPQNAERVRPLQHHERRRPAGGDAAAQCGVRPCGALPRHET
jgi:integrase